MYVEIESKLLDFELLKYEDDWKYATMSLD